MFPIVALDCCVKSLRDLNHFPNQRVIRVLCNNPSFKQVQAALLYVGPMPIDERLLLRLIRETNPVFCAETQLGIVFNEVRPFLPLNWAG